jgi:hypothetical protein
LVVPPINYVALSALVRIAENSATAFLERYRITTVDLQQKR